MRSDGVHWGLQHSTENDSIKKVIFALQLKKPGNRPATVPRHAKCAECTLCPHARVLCRSFWRSCSRSRVTSFNRKFVRTDIRAPEASCTGVINALSWSGFKWKPWILGCNIRLYQHKLNTTQNYNQQPFLLHPVDWHGYTAAHTCQSAGDCFKMSGGCVSDFSAPWMLLLVLRPPFKWRKKGNGYGTGGHVPVGAQIIFPIPLELN